MWNLTPKSRRCHHAKHHGWTVTTDAFGRHTWTSPLGHSYTRPGVWQAPPPLPDNLTLPPPRLAQHDDHDPHPLDLPLWTEPTPKKKTKPQPKPERNWKDEPPF